MKNSFLIFIFFVSITITYSQSPQVDWLEHYGTGNDEFSWKIIRDFQDNYFTVTGFKGGTSIAGQNFTHLGSSNLWDFVISKFDSSNNLIWQKHLYGTADPIHPGLSDMSFPDCKIDGSGNLFIFVTYDGILYLDDASLVSGNTQQFETTAHSIIKINTTGTIDWKKNLVLGSSIAVSNRNVFDLDNSGEILIHIWCYDGNVDVVINGNVILPITSSFGNILFARFSPTGNYLWHSLMPEGIWNSSQIKLYNTQEAFLFGYNGGNLILNASNNVTLSTTTGSEVFVAKLQAISFAYIYWAKRILGLNCNLGQMLTDNVGNLVVFGTSNSNLDFGDGISLNSSSKHAFLAKYSSEGITLMAKSLVEGNVSLRSISKDNVGNYYICGSFTESLIFNNGQQLLTNTSSIDVGFIAKYNETGDCLWAISTESTSGMAITWVDAVSDNEIYLSGRFKGISTFEGINLTGHGETDPFYAKMSGCQIPDLQIMSSGNTTICNGQVLTLTVNLIPNATYQWFKNGLPISNANNIELIVDQAGQYSIGAYIGGCGYTSDIITVQVSNVAFNLITIPANTSGICPGGELILTTSIPFASYSWSNGAQSNLNTINQAGSYQVVVTDFSGCTGTAGIQISALLPPPVPDIQINSGTDCILVCISSIQPSSYKWRKNGNVVGNNSQFLDITTLGNGFYTVEIKNANGCSSITSPCSIVNCMDCIVDAYEQNINKNKIKIYPNPSHGRIIYEIFEKGYYRFKVFNTIGEIEYSIDKVSEKSELNLSFLTNGLYILQFETGEGIKLIEKLIIQNK